MKNYLFKTDIHCKSCLSKIEKLFNNQPEIKDWRVDWNTKILEITANIQDIHRFEDWVFENTQVYIEEIKD